MATPSTNARDSINPLANAKQIAKRNRSELSQHRKRVKELEEENMGLRRELREVAEEARNAADILALRKRFKTYREHEKSCRDLAQLDAESSTPPEKSRQVGKVVEEVAEDGEAQRLVRCLAEEVVCYLEKLGNMATEQMQGKKKAKGTSAAAGEISGVANREHGDDLDVEAVNEKLQKQINGLDSTIDPDHDGGITRSSKPPDNISADQLGQQTKGEASEEADRDEMLLPILSRLEAANFANFIREASGSLAELLRGDDIAIHPLGDPTTKAIAQVIEMSGQFFAYALGEMVSVVALADDQIKGIKEKLKTTLTVLQEMKVKVATMQEELTMRKEGLEVLDKATQFPLVDELEERDPQDQQDQQEQTDQGHKKKKKKRRAKKNKKNTELNEELPGQSLQTSEAIEGILRSGPRELDRTPEHARTSIPKTIKLLSSDEQAWETQGIYCGWESSNPPSSSSDASHDDAKLKEIERRPKLQPKSRLKTGLSAPPSPADPIPTLQPRPKPKVVITGSSTPLIKSSTQHAVTISESLTSNPLPIRTSANTTQPSSTNTAQPGSTNPHLPQSSPFPPLPPGPVPQNPALALRHRPPRPPRSPPPPPYPDRPILRPKSRIQKFLGAGIEFTPSSDPFTPFPWPSPGASAQRSRTVSREGEGEGDEMQKQRLEDLD
ncbi:hypothetical protein AOQ84DRAFT_377093 [Glonium stellatum]|uniref:Uncharacterized protein n=1 Tax=Glonium stellatum TaxID=574774 RepID=A0A8E2JST0_9PEZI|nr:hypothetical protein AOQ84DRAFT_377093 [Glonium stellatum]